MTGKQVNGFRRGGYKLWFDPALLASVHLIFLPLFLLLWTIIPFIIWLGDRGPVFYRQQRVGKDGRVFIIRKFRTMVPDAEHLGPAWTIEADPRVTNVGKFLRRTALDELPELVSIWKGDMSLVGPRALHVKEQEGLERQIPGFASRLQTLPGLTGLAQVYAPTDDADDKLHYDMAYLRSMSPWLDVKLIAISVWNTLRGRWDRRGGKPGIEPVPPSSKEPTDERQEISG